MISWQVLVIKFSILKNWFPHLFIPSFCYIDENGNCWVILSIIFQDIKINVFISIIISLVHYIRRRHLIMQILLIQIESKLLLEKITDTVQNFERIHSNLLIIKKIFLTILLHKARRVDTCRQNTIAKSFFVPFTAVFIK